jgi:hypothetical protein
MFKTDFKFLTAFAMMLATLLMGGVAEAQEKPSGDAADIHQPAGSEAGDSSGQASESKRAVKRSRKGPPRVIELEELVIEGRIQKPEVFYVLGRASSRYEKLELKRDFVDRIVKSVENNPF